MEMQAEEAVQSTVTRTCSDNPSEAQFASDKALRAALLRSALPACQPQEGSPANTFTGSELQELQAALPNLNLRPRNGEVEAVRNEKAKLLDICAPWEAPHSVPIKNDWYGAPTLSPNADIAREFRLRVRQGLFKGPTNAQCPGFLQCNLVVLPQGQHAFDFLLFCQRNPKACPLLEVCDVGSAIPSALVAGADLRTDCPR